MITVTEVKERLRVLNYRLQTLAEQREQNATEAEWSIVKAIKEQESKVRFEKKILESVLTPEDFMDVGIPQGSKDSPYHKDS